MMNTLLREDADGCCTLTLNRPAQLNALDTALFEQLDAQLDALERATDRIGCVVLRGAGRAFCAGADLKSMGQSPLPPGYKPGVVERLGHLPQPVIAAVHGVCYTGGLELALACDFILADTNARFADTHGTWGLVSAWGMAQRLPLRIGQAAAKRMMMTGRPISADQALGLGLVDDLAPAGTLDTCLAHWVQELLANSWHTNFSAKRMMRETAGLPIADALTRARAMDPGPAADAAARIARFRSR